MRNLIWRILGLHTWQSEIEHDMEKYMTQTDIQLERLSSAIASALTLVKEARDEAQAVIDNDATEDAAQAVALDQGTADKLSLVVDAFEAALNPAAEVPAEEATLEEVAVDETETAV